MNAQRGFFDPEDGYALPLKSGDPVEKPNDSRIRAIPLPYWTML